MDLRTSLLTFLQQQRTHLSIHHMTLNSEGLACILWQQYFLQEPVCKGSPASKGTDASGSHGQQLGPAMCCVQGAGGCKRAMRASAAAAICSRRFIASASAFVSLLPLPSSFPLQAPASAQHPLQACFKIPFLRVDTSRMSTQLWSLAVARDKTEDWQKQLACPLTLALFIRLPPASPSISPASIIATMSPNMINIHRFPKNCHIRGKRPLSASIAFDLTWDNLENWFVSDC